MLSVWGITIKLNVVGVAERLVPLLAKPKRRAPAHGSGAELEV